MRAAKEIIQAGIRKPMYTCGGAGGGGQGPQAGGEGNNVLIGGFLAEGRRRAAKEITYCTICMMYVAKGSEITRRK